MQAANTLSVGALAGIIVGCIVGCINLLAIGLILVKKCKDKAAFYRGKKQSKKQPKAIINNMPTGIYRCSCSTNTFLCPFCGIRFKHRVRNVNCDVHGRLDFTADIRCKGCGF